MGAVIFFVFLSALVLMFAFGFRYDFKNNRFSKTGSIVLKPNLEAQIFINEELVGRTSFLNSAFSKKQLLPGKYTVRVEKDQSVFWQKEIGVEEGLVSDFSRIVLFDEGQLEQISASLKNPLSVNRAGQKAAYWEKGALSFYDLTEGGQPLYQYASSAFLFDSRVLKIIWGTEANEVLAYDQSQAIYFDLTKKISKNIGSPQQYFLESAVLKSGRLYFLRPSSRPTAGKELVWLDLENQKSKVVARNLKSFLIFKNEILAISVIPSSAQLVRIGLSGENKQVLAGLSLGEDLIIKKAENRNGDYFVLINSRLYSFSPTADQLLAEKNGEISLIANEVRDFSISPDNTVVGWHTGKEFWVAWIKDAEYQPLKKSGERELVMRAPKAGNIRGFSWYKNSGYVFLELEKSLVVTETDLRGGLNSYTILSLAGQEQAWYDLSRNKIFKLSNLSGVVLVDMP